MCLISSYFPKSYGEIVLHFCRRNPCAAYFRVLGRVTVALNDWMSRNFLQLNNKKTEMIVFGAKEEQIKSADFKTTNEARNLGVVMDSDLNFLTVTLQQ